MRTALISLGLAILPTGLSAEGFLDNAVFGVSLVNQTLEIEVGGSEGASSYSQTGTGLGVYMDYYYRPRYRFNATLNYLAYDDFDIAETIVSADYLYPLNDTFSFFAGLAGGVAMQKFNDAGIGDAALGIVYGAQLGGFLYINENLMFEAGYRMRPTDIETEVGIPSGTTTNVTDLSESYLSVMMKF